jgi:hypothetical protein
VPPAFVAIRRRGGGLRLPAWRDAFATRGATWAERGVAAATALFLAATLAFALAPLTANDALVYHLNLPRLYLEAGSTAPVPWNAYSRMPGAMEFLYTFARALGPEATPRLVHWWMGALVLLAAWSLARRVSRETAFVTLAILLATPLMGDPRTVGNIDLAITFYFALALIAAADAPVLAGVFLGFMSGMRYTAMALAAVAAVAGLLRGGRARRRRALAGAGVIAGMSLPWLLRAALRSGNPVYPLVPGVFGGAGWNETLGRQLVAWQRSMGMGRGIAENLLLPWNATIHGQVAAGYRFFDGVIGPWYLALGLLWLAGVRRAAAWERTLFGILAAGGLLWAAGPEQVRFAMPLLVPAALLGATALAGLERTSLRRAVMAVLAIAALAEGGTLAIRAAREAGPVLAGRESREAYLEARIQSYGAIAAANRVLPPGAKLLLVWENRGYYLERPYLADSFFEASQVMDLVRESGSPERLAARLEALGVTHVLFNEPLGRHFAERYDARELDILAAFGERCLAPVGSAAGVGLFEFRRGQ